MWSKKELIEKQADFWVTGSSSLLRAAMPTSAKLLSRSECSGLALTKRIRKGVFRRLVLRAGQRAQAGGTFGIGLDEPAPGARQLEQADGVTGRCGVEDDVLVVAGHRWVGQQGGELVKGSHLGGAGT